MPKTLKRLRNALNAKHTGRLIIVKMKEIVEIANNSTKNVGNLNYTESDVVDFFKRSNVGHWPSEKGQLSINMEDGILEFSVLNKKIETNYPLTPKGKIWILGHFFEHLKPQAMQDIDTITSDFDGKHATAANFRAKITKRLSGKSQFVKENNSRIAFTERKRNNFDDSVLYTYDIMNVDDDGSYKLAILLPGLTTVIYIYEQFNGKVIRYKTVTDGRTLEDMKSWERAAYISTMSPKSAIEKTKTMTDNELEAAFLLSEVEDDK